MNFLKTINLYKFLKTHLQVVFKNNSSHGSTFADTSSVSDQISSTDTSWKNLIMLLASVRNSLQL